MARRLRLEIPPCWLENHGTVVTGIESKDQTLPGRPSSGATPFITVAICTRNRAGFLEKAVQSVISQIVSACEILIVDNASTDNTPQLAAGFATAYPQVTVLREPELGLSVARNTALARARGKYVVFLDDDAEAGPGWLDAYKDFFSSPPVSNIACAGGAVFSRHETTPPAWLRPGSDVLDLGGHSRRFQAPAGPWGCNFALHREVALELGGFDVSLGRKGKSLAAHEESDLIERIWQAGHEVWWLPAARIRHFVSAERLRLGWQLRSQYNQGRSSAAIQLRTAAARSRMRGFLFGRLLVAPVHLTLNILLALVSLPLRNGQIAAHALLRCARIAGFSRRLLSEMFQSFAAK